MNPEDSPVGRFAVRRVGLDEGLELLRASLAPFRVAPARLLGMFLLLSLPIYYLFGGGITGRFLEDAIAAVAFTGYTFALDAAARSELPDFRHLGVVLGFDRGKLAVLVVSGVAPLLCAVLLLYAVWGADATSGFLAELSAGQGHESAPMALHLWAAQNVADIPFSFIAPVCALYRWSGSRSMSANLIACIVNWRWVLVTAAVSALAERLLIGLLHQGTAAALLALIGEIGLQMFSLSWTLALLRRSFPPA